MNHIRPARFAGSWYEASPARLSAALDQLIEEAEKSTHPAYGAVLPHAGHTFSGRGIAPFFKNAATGATHLCILAPSHYSIVPPGNLGYASFTEYETPLGSVTAFSKPFEGSTVFVPMDKAIAVEHSAEMFLPFIKRFLPQVVATILLVPRIRGQEDIVRFADVIEHALSGFDHRRVLFIASSDFTHYGDRFDFTPFGTRDIESVLSKTAALDRKYAELLARHERAKVLAEREKDQPSICGLDPALVLSALMERRGLRGELVSYYTSCTVLGPSSDFVCYATILYHE